MNSPWSLIFVPAVLHPNRALYNFTYQEWVDFGMKIGVLLLNACVGFGQDCHAGTEARHVEYELFTPVMITLPSMLV